MTQEVAMDGPTRPCDTCGAPAPRELEEALEPYADHGTLIHNCRVKGDKGWIMAVLRVHQDEDES